MPKFHKAKSQHAGAMLPAPPSALIDLVFNFFEEFGFNQAAFSMTANVTGKLAYEEKSWKKSSKDMPRLVEIFREWEERRPNDTEIKSLKRKFDQVSDDSLSSSESGDGSDTDSSSVSTSSAESDSEEEEEKREEVSRPNKRLKLEGPQSQPALAPTTDLVGQTNQPASSGSESEMESDMDSDSDMDSSSESEGSDSDSDSDLELEDEFPISTALPNVRYVKGMSLSDSSDDASDSDSDSDLDLGSGSDAGSVSEPKSDSNSDSNSDSDSGSDSGSNSGSSATLPIPADEKENKKTSSKTSVADRVRDGQGVADIPSTHSVTSKKSPKLLAAVPEVLVYKTPVASAEGAPDNQMGMEEVIVRANNKNIAKLKKEHIPFSRIPANVTVDPKFSSNKYVPDDYGYKAYEDLVVTKGKGFTKEKNKKKRGSYRGGAIDVSGGKGIKFDD